MKPHRRLKREEYIRKLDADITLADNSEDEIQSTLSKYICIRLGGFIETCMKESIQNFVDDRKSHQIISSYIKNKIRDITNLNSKKIENILVTFSSEWSNQFKERASVDIKNSLGAIYDNRNNIAHGCDSGITLLQLKKHYENLKEAALLIDDIISKK